MYVTRGLISHLYQHLLRTHHALSPPVLILVALEPDALCACRVLTALLKRDYIPHKIQPIAGYGDLSRAGAELVRPMRTCDGGSGGIVICLGVGGLIDLEEALGLEEEDVGRDGRVDDHAKKGLGNVDVWVFDSRRPWHLSNVFGGHGLTTDELLNGADRLPRERGIDKGRVLHNYKPGVGGIFVFDDGDIEEELATEREAYCEIEAMPDLGDESDVSDKDGSGTDSESDRGNEDDEPPPGAQPTRKRKSPSVSDDDDDDNEDSKGDYRSSPPRQKRKHSANSSSPINREINNTNKLRKRLVRTRQKHERVLRDYYSLGTSYSEPVSSMVYSLASELGREDNDLLWQAIVGVSSLDLYGRTATGIGLVPISTDGGAAGWTGSRGERIRAILRDEVRRLNPTDPAEIVRERAMGDSQMAAIPTHARSANDMSIRLSPEPRFLLVRHWSLYESMLHSPYLSSRLQMWSDAGVRRLHKLLAKMGVSLAQSKQNYVHMDMDIKRGLRERLLKYAPVYGLEGLLPTASHTLGKEGWGFVRFWGWKACLSAADVSIIVGAVLELGKTDSKSGLRESSTAENRGLVKSRTEGVKDIGPSSRLAGERAAQDNVMGRFWAAYDALGSVNVLMSHIQTAQHLHRAIFRTGKSLIMKKQIHHLRAFRIAVVKEGPDIQLFTHPGALVKLALWLQEAIEEINGSRGDTKGNELVLAGLDEDRGVYVVVGLGGGSKPGLSQQAAREKTQKREARRKRKEAAAETKRQTQEARRLQRRNKRSNRPVVEKEDDEAASAAGNSQGESDSSEEDEDEDEDEDDEDDESEDEDTSGSKTRKNRFGLAFLEVAEESGARVKLDSFEHSVVEVKKEDLSGFLEGLSMKRVVK